MKVLVLGGTSAIAQEFCRLLAPKQVAFFLAGRNAAHLDAIAADLRVRGSGTVHTLVLDLTDKDLHECLLNAAWQEMGDVDLCLLAYGVLGDQKEAEADPAEAARVFETNFVSAAALILRLASRFAGQGTGKLAVIASVAGDRGRKSNFVYGTSKAALATLMEGLRHRYHGSALQFLTVKPGLVDTPMTAHMAKSALFTTPRKVAEAILKGLEKGKSTVYAPFYWRFIMLLIRHVPEFVFNRTNL